MSEEEIVLKQEAGVKSYDSASPPTIGFKAGAFADVGSLILTNRRLVYISKGGMARAAAWVVSPLAALAVEKRVSKAELDELAKHKGSYSIPLSAITKVEASRKMGSEYLRVDHPNFGEKPAHSYIFGGGWSKKEDWVAAINSALDAARSTPAPSTTVPSAAQPPPTRQRFCPNCGAQVAPGSRFCPNCGNRLS